MARRRHRLFHQNLAWKSHVLDRYIPAPPTKPLGCTEQSFSPGNSVASERIPSQKGNPDGPVDPSAGTKKYENRPRQAEIPG